MKLVILRGLPGCGKSTIAEKLSEKLEVSRRRTSGGGKLVNTVCYCLNSNHYYFILEQLVKGEVIVDNNNLEDSIDFILKNLKYR